MDRLETDQLILRRFRPEDGEDLYEYLSREEVVRYEPYGVFTEAQAAREAERRSTDAAFWAVCLKSTGKMIGNLYFQAQEPQKFETWELGYVFSPVYQGQGYATEACRRLLEHAFDPLGIRRVVARCNPDNTRSWRLLERLRFRREGHACRAVYFKYDENSQPIWHDTFAYGLLRSEWLNHNS